MAIVATSSSTTPGVRTCDQLVAEAMSYVRAPNDPEVKEIAKQGLNNGIRQLNMRNWQWSLQSEELTLAADDGDYTIANNYKASYSLMRLDTNDKTRGQLQWEDPQTFDKRFWNRSASGNPAWYTVFKFQNDQQLTLNAPASSSFIATYPKLLHRHTMRIGLLVHGGDSLDGVPSEVESYIVRQAETHLADRFEPSKSVMARATTYAIWNELVRDDNESPHKDWSTT